MLMDHTSVTFLGTEHRVRKSAQLMSSLIFEPFCTKYVLMNQSNVTFSGAGRRMRRKSSLMLALIFALFCANYTVPKIRFMFS
jgi:hypothetical protein